MSSKCLLQIKNYLLMHSQGFSSNKLISCYHCGGIHENNSYKRHNLENKVEIFKQFLRKAAVLSNSIVPDIVIVYTMNEDKFLLMV